jgi:hypothetical protein
MKMKLKCIEAIFELRFFGIFWHFFYYFFEILGISIKAKTCTYILNIQTKVPFVNTPFFVTNEDLTKLLKLHFLKCKV